MDIFNKYGIFNILNHRKRKKTRIYLRCAAGVTAQFVAHLATSGKKLFLIWKMITEEPDTVRHWTYFIICKVSNIHDQLNQDIELNFYTDTIYRKLELFISHYIYTTILG